MKNICLLFLAMFFLSLPVYSQTENQADTEEELLGLPGDNLNLYAVLDLFQKSKTIEDFEKSLNDEKTGINNLDLNLDEKVDFIKVATKQDGDDFTFILQVDVSEKEIQDVAVILVSKDKEGKITMQIVGDKDLYGKDYVVEPAPKVTANPGYTGSDPVVVNEQSTTTVVVVESAPIVQYVYSPAYVPYYPPYYYGYYPPYFAAFTVMAVGIYRHNHYHNYYGCHGGYGGNVYIHNERNFNNYNQSRNRSNTVNHNKANGNYNRSSSRPSASTRPSTGQARTSASTRPSTSQARTSAATKPSTSQARSSASTRPSSSYNNSSASRSKSSYPSSSSSRYNSPSRSSAPSRSYGGSRGGGRRR